MRSTREARRAQGECQGVDSPETCRDVLPARVVDTLLRLDSNTVGVLTPCGVKTRATRNQAVGAS